jgi:phage N-6-adenine-methyltransferase
MCVLKHRSRNHPAQVASRGAIDVMDDRATPAELFAEFDRRFRFTIDVAAAAHNAKCRRFYSIEDDGLEQPWQGNVWCNPPYSNLRAWLQKAWSEWFAGRPRVIVLLAPANRTDQPFWQDLIEPHRDRQGGVLRAEFLPGRIRFLRRGATKPGPNERPLFGCVALIWERPTA